MTRLRTVLKRRARTLPALAFSFLALPSLALAAGEPQIFKCTDGSGNITYQNEPCPKDSKSGRIEIFDNRWTATREEREAEWRRNAADHRLLTGMPARWVREALGEPTEIRDTPTGGAAQLWLFNLRDRSVQVGMLNDQVLWFRESPTASPEARVVPPTAQRASEATSSAPPAAASASRPADLPVMRMLPTESERLAAARASAPVTEQPATETRTPTESAASSTAAPGAADVAPASGTPAAKTQRAVARGQDCRQALSDLGPPDRQRDVPALDTGSDPATEYFYESATTGRLRIVCANGKVEGVDRSVAR